MPGVDDLSPDQRAVLALLLAQGKGYGEIAQLLSIGDDAVRGRAAAALDALAGEPAAGAAPLPAERRARLADWLLGQADDPDAEATGRELRESAAALDWAARVAERLRPLGGARVPDVPAVAPGAPAGTGPGAGLGSHAPAAAPGGAGDEPRLPGFGTAGDGGHRPRSSRLGGALLLAGAAVLVAVVLVVLLTRDSGGSPAATATAPAGTPAAASTTSTTPRIEGQVNLSAPGGGRALGVASVIAQGGRRAVAIQAEKLRPNTRRDAYAVWLADGRGGAVRRLGFAPAVSRNGRLQGVATLPADASSYRRLEISLETATDPKRPGRVVLRGTFKGR